MRSELVSTGDRALPLRVVRGERLEFAFLPSVGGRLLSLRVDGRELLWQNPAFFSEGLQCVRPRSEWKVLDGTLGSWSNVGGSKSWPAPQGWSSDEQWPGPPDPVLDSGEWSWEESSDRGLLSIRMTSADDLRTGLQVTRSFSIPSTGTAFTERIQHRAVGGRRVRWAAWEVCQVRTEGSLGDPSAGVAVATAGECRPLVQGDWWGRMRTERRGDHEWIPSQEVVAKRGFSDATGLVSWTAPDGAGIDFRFEPDAAAEYPDGGARVEIWMQAPLLSPLDELAGLHPDAHIVELEVLGPWVSLEPGESSELTMEWNARAATP